MLSTSDVREIYARSSAAFGERVHAVDGRWEAPSPLPGWTVRQLVNHLVNEERWTPPLLSGSTIEEVGPRFDGDLLGVDPVAAFDDAAAAALAAVRADGALDATVHLSFGDHPAREYAMQLAADHLVHGWDLAVATGGDPRLDPRLVHAIGAWFEEREEDYRRAGAVGARQGLTGDDSHDLLARFGRDATWGPRHRTLVRFNAAFGACDVDAALDLVTDDIVFDATSPAPDGRRVEGKEAVRAAWTEVMGTPGMEFTEEESFVAGDRAVVRWRYGWSGETSGHVRGVDVIRFRDGLVSEKLSYVKG